MSGYAQKRWNVPCERFRWPDSREEVLESGHGKLRRLLDGLETSQGKADSRVHYSAI